MKTIIGRVYFHYLGRALSGEILQIFEEFKEEFEKFNSKTYNPLDPKNTVRSNIDIQKRFFGSKRKQKPLENSRSIFILNSLIKCTLEKQLALHNNQLS